MWDAIGHVSTGLTLIAFMVAAAVSAYRLQLRSRIKTIEAVPPSERGKLIEKELNAFGIDAGNLSRTQQFEIALRELNLRSRKLLALTLVVVLITLIFGLISFNALLGDTSASKRLSKYKSELSEIKKDMDAWRNAIVSQEKSIERYRQSIEFYEPQGKQHLVDSYKADIAGCYRVIGDYEGKLQDLSNRRAEVEALVSKYEQCLMEKKC